MSSLRVLTLVPIMSLAAACTASTPAPGTNLAGQNGGSNFDPAPTSAPIADAGDAKHVAETACWDRFVSYCPDEGPATCMANGLEQTLSTCASAGGHCVAAGSSFECVIGPAVCDELSFAEGTRCTGEVTCEAVSRMGNMSCKCSSGKWSCAHAGI